MARPTDKRDKGQVRRRAPAPEPSRRMIAFGPTNYTLFAVAAAAIVVGYVLLARGDITLAPILLVLGYVVLLPAAILVRRDLPGE